MSRSSKAHVLLIWSTIARLLEIRIPPKNERNSYSFLWECQYWQKSPTHLFSPSFSLVTLSLYNGWAPTKATCFAKCSRIRWGSCRKGDSCKVCSWSLRLLAPPGSLPDPCKDDLSCRRRVLFRSQVGATLGPASAGSKGSWVERVLWQVTNLPCLWFIFD